MISFPLSKLATIFAIATPPQDISFQGISTDTRTLQRKNLFVALEGENHDGHFFIEEAQKKGAVAALVKQQTASSLQQMVVPDTVKALGELAFYWRKQFTLPVVGLTGSNGKTTLKNMVASILRAACGHSTDASHSTDAGHFKEDVLATEGNLNNHIGVPLILARLNTSHRYGVIEMGMNHLGEIAYLSRLVCPTVAIITNAAPAHLQGVSDLAGVARAKGEIFLGLSPQGTAILNKEDKYFSYWKELIGQRTFLSFGLQATADVYAIIHATPDSLKQYITIKTPNDTIEIMLPLLGRHNVLNAVAAAAACTALEIDGQSIKTGLENIEPARGRLQVHSFPQDIRLIDDTYNANPASLEAAIKVLTAFAGNKILVLGDMRELGDRASDLHANMGNTIRQAGIDHLFTYGELSEEMSKHFGDNAHHFRDQQCLADVLRKHIKPNTTFLVKGSRFMKMENIVAVLKGELETI